MEMNSTDLDYEPSYPGDSSDNLKIYTNSSVTERGDSRDPNNTVEEIFRLIILIYFLISLVGNTLSLCVFTKKSFREISCSNLACFDIFTLFLQLIKVFIVEVYPNVISHPVVCIIWTTCTQNSRRISNWTLLALTTDRMIAVLFPLRSITMCTTKRAVRVVIGVVSAITLTGVKNIWLVSVHNGVCRGYNIMYMDIVRQFTWFEIGIDGLAPAALILIFNISLLLGLGKQRAQMSRQMNRHMQNNYQRDQKMTQMLLFVSFFFLITQIPRLVMRVLSIFEVTCPLPYRGTDREVCRLVTKVLNSLHTSNYAFNFVLYCLSGSKFRKELKRVFCSVCTRETPNTGVRARTTDGST